MHKELLVAVIGTILSLIAFRAAPQQEGSLAHRVMMFHTDTPDLNEKPNAIATRSIPLETCAGGEIVSCFKE